MAQSICHPSLRPIIDGSLAKREAARECGSVTLGVRQIGSYSGVTRKTKHSRGKRPTHARLFLPDFDKPLAFKGNPMMVPIAHVRHEGLKTERQQPSHARGGTDERQMSES